MNRPHDPTAQEEFTDAFGAFLTKWIRLAFAAGVIFGVGISLVIVLLDR